MEDIGIAPVNIADVTRLGAKVANKSRPLRVQFNNVSQRRSVLSNAKKLRNSSSRSFKEIFINPDLSSKERQAQKELRSELARRKEAGESGIFIRRGRIVKQNKTINQAVSNPREVPSEDMMTRVGNPYNVLTNRVDSNDASRPCEILYSNYSLLSNSDDTPNKDENMDF